MYPDVCGKIARIFYAVIPFSNLVQLFIYSQDISCVRKCARTVNQLRDDRTLSLVRPRWRYSESVVSMENVWNEGNLLPISQSRLHSGSQWRIRWHTVRIFAIFVAVLFHYHFSNQFPRFFRSVWRPLLRTLVFHEQHVVKSYLSSFKAMVRLLRFC